jgi:hypothetical protein
MDGAAEEYMLFSYRSLTQAEYASGKDHLIVEAFDMGRVSEAFGIFSTRFEGDPVAVGQGARYGVARLSMWQGRYCFAIYEKNGRDAARPAILALGQAVAQAAGASRPLPPFITGPARLLSPKRLSYMHSWLHLSNLYYLSTDDILGLSRRTDVLFMDLSQGGKPVRAMVVRYRSKADRDAGWAGLCKQFLRATPAAAAGNQVVLPVEGAKVCGATRCDRGRYYDLYACFEAPTPAICEAALTSLGASVP